VRLATWNVNSIRARLDRVVDWVRRSDLDVIALQETRCRDEAFPRAEFEALGYQVAHRGWSQWNGVAILSRVGLAGVEPGFPAAPGWGDPPQVEARAIGATCGGVRLWSLYVPNGRNVADPHMAYKLAWLARLADAGRQWLADDPDAPVALVGDWNIAPQDGDVWSMEYYLDKSHVSPPERAAFGGVVEAGFEDIVRPHAPGPGVYTYWDYKQLSFPKRKGMRIDFVLASPALAKRVTGALIDREERKGKGASDHAPVVVDIAS
jgi:exodeoxyribonuclease-3